MSPSDPRSTPDDWRTALALLDALLDLEPSARAAALAASDAAEPVRERVRRMLDAEDARCLIDDPLVPLDRDAAAVDAGARLGRWQLLDRIGQGGMSTVWRARSLEEPVGQRAALKRLDPAVMDAAGLRRFEREMGILATLRHPGVATILDAGRAADGVPWFAMTLVDGEPIDRWCAAHSPDLRTRVDLLRQACHAVAHAHRHLVVHRDIKPGNVLVDRDGRVVLVDFGISRLIEDTRRDGDGADATGTYAFTPRFAAPEQRVGGAISTATDLWGLGALGHFILGNGAPVLAEGAAAVVPPSTLPADLRAILSRCLQRDPAERYRSADALADDLQAFLDGRAVRARGDGLAYRTGRWLRQHPAVAALSAALVLSLLGGVAASLQQAQRAEAEAARAVEAQRIAERRLSVTRELVMLLIPANLADARLDPAAGIDAAQRKAESALADDPIGLARVGLMLVSADLRVGRVDAAWSRLATVAARLEAAESVDAVLRADVLFARANVAARQDREVGIVEADYRAAIGLYEDAGESQGRRGAQRALAVFLSAAGREVEALAVLDEAMVGCPRGWSDDAACIDLIWQRGAVLLRIGRTAEALPLLEAADTHFRRHPRAEEAAHLEVRWLLASALGRLGREDDAIHALQPPLVDLDELGPAPSPTPQRALGALASNLGKRNRFAEAVVASQRAIEMAVQLQGEGSNEHQNALTALANLHYGAGEWETALAIYRRVHRFALAAYGEEHAAVAIAEGNIGNALRDRGDALAAMGWQLRATGRIARTLGVDNQRYAQRLSNLARTRAALGDLSGARRDFDAAIALYARHGQTGSPIPDYLRANRAAVRWSQGETTIARDEVLGGLDSLKTARGERDPMALEALGWAINLHCRTPRSDECGTLLADADRLLADRTSLPPLEARLLHQASRQSSPGMIRRR